MALSKAERMRRLRENLGANFDEVMGTNYAPLKHWKEPMLSSKLDSSDFPGLKWPFFISPKIDGIRAVRHAGAALTRSNKPIPNLFIQRTIDEITKAMPVDKKGVNLVHGLDGELIVGSPTALDVFNKTTSGVRAQHGEPDFTWYVFDRYDKWEGGDSDGQPRGRHFGGSTYDVRLQQVEHIVKTVNHPRLQLVPHTLYSVPTMLDPVIEWSMDQGYEGIMLNAPFALYRCGRPSKSMNILHKIKPLEDFEATIVGFVEQNENLNEAFENERGRSQRSSAKDGKRGKGTLGAFVCVDSDGVEFRCGMGPGLTAELRQYIWDHREEYDQQLGKFRKQKVGQVVKPRQPRFLGLRSLLDLSPAKKR